LHVFSVVTPTPETDGMMVVRGCVWHAVFIDMFRLSAGIPGC
jgi:hypothetical protein